ncbi:MAG TPA: ATP-binding protein [Gemmatimonadaceae bacterium]|nr:ATP-binding protein [Gemmatimonadaceae bacterium]
MTTTQAENQATAMSDDQRETIPARIAALADPGSRPDAVAALARAMGSDDILIFLRDEETGRMVTAPGFVQTLPDGRRWRAFLADCAGTREHTATLPLRAGEPEVSVTGYAIGADDVIVIVGRAEPRALAWLVALLPLLASLFRGERAAAFAELKARQSGEAAARAETLARTLDLARLQLEAALAQAREARAQLESSNMLLHDQAIELEAQAEELEATAVELEERTEEAERARRSAELAEQRLQMIFEQSPAAVAVTTGADHCFVLANPKYQLLVGRPITTGTTFREALPEVLAQGYEAMLDEVWTTGKARVEHESYARLDKGGPTPEDGWYDFVYQPFFGDDGQVMGIMQHAIEVTGQVRDRMEVERLFHESERQRQATEVARTEAVTARLHAEEIQAQFRALVDAIPTLAWTADGDGFIDWYNARWYEYTGTVAADMTGWGWTSVHDPEVLPTVLERWRESIATGQAFEMTFPLRGRDGVFRQFLTRVLPTRDASGRIVRWFGTNTDVDDTERLRLAAEDANRAKSEFLAIMSHELRTPLNAIDGYAELLEMGIPGELLPAQRDFLGKIRKSQRHLLGLINGVLNYTKIEAGAVHFTREDVAVEETLLTCEALIAPQALAKGIGITVTPGDAGLQINADGEKLQQILLNVLTNATKFTERGGHISLSCRATEKEVYISVSDTGRGIAADQLTRVFEPFVQLDAQLTRTNDGVGLGLAISRDLARGMGGDLTVVSEVGVGSRFTLVLPRA